MNLSRLPSPIAPGAPEPRKIATALDALDGHALMAQLGSEVAEALSAALERVTTLATTGKIGRKGLRELRDAIELARRCGIMGQQVTRLASGRVRQNPERVDLTAAVREALQQHRREIDSRGFEVRQSLSPAQVMADPTLVFTLLQALFDWALEHTCSPIDMRIELTSWPVCASLSCGFRFLSDEQIDRQTVHLGGSPLDTMPWRLLQQASATMELGLSRDDVGGTTRVAIEFPRTVNDPSETAALREREDPERLLVNSKPLAGSHLLVMATRRETRTVVRDAVKHMGLMVDFVQSIDEAREFCQGGMPHAILHETALGGERFEKLRKELLIEVPTLSFIELAEEGHGFEVRKVEDRQYSCVSRAAVLEALPAALMFELSRSR